MNAEMSSASCEVTRPHPRLLKLALAVEESRVYWSRWTPAVASLSRLHDEAFEQSWFGAKSQGRVRELLRNLDARFGQCPQAVRVLQGWSSMTPESRVSICHWHLQRVDPLYRDFTGSFLVDRRAGANPELYRPKVVAWLTERRNPDWTLATRKELAGRLASTARAAGLLTGRQNPWALRLPRVSDEALTYLLYLLRSVRHDGTLLDNPYLRSVGLEGRALDERLRKLPAFGYQRIADVIELDWKYRSLGAWASAELAGSTELT